MDNRHFNCGKFSLPLGKKVYVMGVLNVTPDSFSDGGLYTDTDIAVFHALEMRRLGADIIDIGAVSTAPGSAPVTAQQEIARLGEIVERLVPQLDIPMSLDTTNPITARAFLEKGVSIINDVSGSVSQETALAAAEYGAGLIVTHGGDAGDGAHRENITDEVNGFFSNAVGLAGKYGVDTGHLCLDCGIGFSKSRDNDLELLKNFGTLKNFGCATLVGASRKRVLREATGESSPEKNDPATVSAHTVAIFGGADIIRAHDVFSAVQCAKTAFALKGAPSLLNSRGKIEIRGLKLFAYHGVNPEEKKYGQNFILDIDAFADVSCACRTDNVEDTVNYAAVIKCVRAAMTGQSFNLIEAAAQFTAEAVLKEFPLIDEIRILLKKPDSPVKAETDYVAAELKIKRNVINRKDGVIYCE